MRLACNDAELWGLRAAGVGSLHSPQRPWGLEYGKQGDASAGRAEEELLRYAADSDADSPASPVSGCSSSSYSSYSPSPSPSPFPSINSSSSSSSASSPSPFLPRLSSASPFPALQSSHPHVCSAEFRITDNSHSHSNPSQRKKGGCKPVTLSISSAAFTLSVRGKCDVRKSFSNSSFAKHYARGQWAVVAAEAGDVVVVVEEGGKRGRDGRWFVGMERGCTPPWAEAGEGAAAGTALSRHPLLAFAADAVYKVTVMTRGAEQVDVQMSCQFEQGSATVSMKGISAAATAAKVKRSRETEAVDDDSPSKRSRDDSSRSRSMSVSVEPAAASTLQSSSSCPALSASDWQSLPSAPPPPSPVLSIQLHTASDSLYLDELPAFALLPPLPLPSPALTPSSAFVSSAFAASPSASFSSPPLFAFSPCLLGMVGADMPEFVLKAEGDW